MYAVDVFLLFVVTFSVILFIIVDSSRKACPKEEQIENVLESVKATDDDDDDDDDERRSMVSECEEERIEDWEGVERSELDKTFGKAVVFVSCKKNGDENIDEDVKSELYALQNLVLQGPASHASQPFLFNLSARANWNAWQKLGNMSRERAMEKYIDILTKTIPDWKVEHTSRDLLLHMGEGVGTNNEAIS